MKRKSYIILMTLAIASVAVIMFACKKENEPVANSANPNPPETQAVLERVNAFKSRIEYYKANPAVKDGETESIDDAIYDIEALFNFTYAYPELSYSRTVSYDTTLQLPVSNGRVLMTDLTLFYGRMYEAISELYHSAELSDKQFLILDVEAGELHGNTLSVNLHTVQGSVRGIQPPVEPPVQWMGPFEEGERWHACKENGGPNHEEGNAATKLTYWINQLAVPQAPNGYSYVYTNIIKKTSSKDANFYPFSRPGFSVPDSYCEFYVNHPTTEEEWLNSEQLNFHYWGERYHIFNYLANENGVIPSTHVFFNVEIIAYSTVRGNNVYDEIWHKTTASYGVQLLVGQGSIIKAEL
ncbi:MAG: hypothetical protein MJZ94_03355 [Bacteroidales bacterium]|nr:hypothetical protein [Bacteroidales bacterium]